MTVTTEVFPTIVPRSAAPPSAHLRLAIAAAGCPGFAGRWTITGLQPFGAALL